VTMEFIPAPTPHGRYSAADGTETQRYDSLGAQYGAAAAAAEHEADDHAPGRAEGQCEPEQREPRRTPGTVERDSELNGAADDHAAAAGRVLNAEVVLAGHSGVMPNEWMSRPKPM
jgi:hypothetical protein